MMLAPAAISRYSRSLQRALPARAAPATRGLPAVSSCCAGPFINARPAPATMAAADLPDGSAAALARDLAREAASGTAPARREAVAALAACLVRSLSSLPACAARAAPQPRPRLGRGACTAICARWRRARHLSGASGLCRLCSARQNAPLASAAACAPSVPLRCAPAMHHGHDRAMRCARAAIRVSSAVASLPARAARKSASPG
jgi:hypothetical protein